MTPDEIRSTDVYKNASLHKLDALDSGQAYWMREITAQLAEANVYLQHLAAGLSNVTAQLDAIRTNEQKAKSKSSVADKPRRSGD